MKKIIYFPSLSVGNPNTTMTANFTYSNGVSCRFYDKTLVPKELFHPFFLITGGYFYEKLDIRDKFGIPRTSLVMGDSGGYQISTGTLSYSKELVHQIFTWLETVSDIAINLDIPPRTIQTDAFNERLNISYDNFKYFHEHQSGKTKFLNVLQGGSMHLANTWYNKVKDFEFQGWSIGGSNSVYKLLTNISVLLQNKEHLKSYNKYLHILGSTKPLHLLILMKLQKLFEENNINVQVTTDSSTPSIVGAYGGWINGFSYNNLSFQNINLPKNGIYKENSVLPISTYFDKYVLLDNMPFNKIVEYEREGYISVILHNLYFILDIVERLQYLIYSDKIIQEQVFSVDTLKLLSVLEEIFYHDNPLLIFQRYETLLMDYDRNRADSIDNEKTKEFFEF